jgi:hypothetical protein
VVGNMTRTSFRKQPGLPMVEQSVWRVVLHPLVSSISQALFGVGIGLLCLDFCACLGLQGCSLGKEWKS